MADEDLATRAPESDAQEDSGVPSDSKPDQSATSVGEHCTTDRPTPAGEHPTGEMTKFNDTEVYITKPADYPHSPCKLLLLLTGGTGVHSTNNQLQADKYAAEGFLVVMPDQFGGDPAPSTTTTTTATSGTPSSLLEQLKLGVASVAKSFTIDMWLARHTPATVLPRLHAVLTSVREEFADAVANGGGIHAVGYCFGAKYVLLLASETSESSVPSGSSTATGQSVAEAEEGRAGSPRVGPQIVRGAIAHGAQVTRDDMAAVSVPMCVVAVEDDPLFPDEIRNAGLEAMKGKGVEHEFRVYPDVPHGFAVFGDYADGTIVQKQTEAFEQMLGWLKRH